MTSVWFLVGLAVAGIGLIVAGAARSNVILTSVGGSMFGTAIGSLMSVSSNQIVFDAIRKSLGADFRSDELRLFSFRIKWHSYHVTRKGGKFVWHHSELNFKKTISPGVLYCETLQTDKEGVEKKYVVTAGLRDARLIMFSRGEETDESTMIVVYPFAGHNFGSRHCGLRIHTTWDKTDSVSRAILSKAPINGWTKVGDVSEDVAKELDKIWESEFEQHNHIFKDTQHANT
jgi:hypothetical protein